MIFTAILEFCITCFLFYYFKYFNSIVSTNLEFRSCLSDVISTASVLIAVAIIILSGSFIFDVFLIFIVFSFTSLVKFISSKQDKASFSISSSSLDSLL